MKKALTVSLICFLAFGCIEQSNGQNITDLQKSIIEKQIDSIFHTMIEAAENLDYDILSTGVDDRHNAGFIVNGSYYTTYDSLENTLKANMQAGTRQNITIKKEKITVLSDNVVLLAASGVSEVKLNTGQTFNGKFLWSFVYENINNTWKVIQSHQSRAN